MALEGIHRLVHQRHSVGQEQHPLGPVGAHQHIGQRDHRARLARTGGHHCQRLAQVVFLEGLADAAHRPHLVVALNDAGVDRRCGQRLAAGAALDHQRQLGLVVEPLHRTRRVENVVPDPVLIAVGAEDHRPLAVLGFQAIGIQLGLLLAHFGALLRALGFHQRQRLAVVAPQHVVHEALALLVGHAGDLDLEVLLRVELPAGLLEQQVDEVVAGLCFGIVVGVGLGGVGLLGGGHGLAQPGQLGIQCRRGAQQRGEPFIALCQLRLQLLQLVQGLLRHGRCCGGRPGQQRRVEGQPRVGPAALPVGARQPVGDVEQLTRGHQGISRQHLAGAVHRLVAEVLDHLGLGEHRLAHQPGEAGLVDQRA